MMSRRRNHYGIPPWEATFTVVCTDRGSHRPVPLGLFHDLRNGPVNYPEPDEIGPDEDYDAVCAEMEDAQRGIFVRSGSRGRGRNSIDEYPKVFTRTRAGVKTRLRCSLCGRDEQFNSERFDRFADAVGKVQGDRMTFALDISAITA
jgi:hypothetical protein